ncbi:hypothetical protein FRC00_005814 [Tulasnella sp. 408]|nr:hypothetical protein FRC00_005814 [Tulasnella sp. 408]
MSRSCSWWFYWTSMAGPSNNAAHRNMDFLPWFIQQMKAKETSLGKRLLDYLDIHYYFQPDTSVNDAAPEALRLRMTQSLSNTSYAVWLIPRMQKLINLYYLGTKLSIGEWASTADGDITGGLVTANCLDIFGRYGVDHSATYWATPAEKDPIGLAHWLYRGCVHVILVSTRTRPDTLSKICYGTYFGSNSVQANMVENIEGIFGFYAGVESGKVSLVWINKNAVPMAFYISNIPTGKYFIRHFGGASNHEINCVGRSLVAEWAAGDRSKMTVALKPAAFELFKQVWIVNKAQSVQQPSPFSQKMHSRLRAALLAPILLAWAASADLDVYVDGALSSGWENWSWNTDLNFAATDLYQGLSSISASSTAWAAFSLKFEGLYNTYVGFQFDIAADPSTLQLYFQGTTDNAQSASIPLSAFPSITSTKFTTVVIDFNALPPSGAPLGSGAWDRLNFQALANGATSITIEPLFLSAEPIGNDLIAITTQGKVDLSTVKVKLNNATVAISKTTTYSPIDTPSKTITYFTLAKSFTAGSLAITAGTNTSFTYTLPAVRYGTINVSNTKSISPDIYGVNWPTSASYIQHLGVTISRWGGNAVTAYNPFGDFTNAGNDWYFENRGSDSADDWLGWVSGTGSKTVMTVPA